MVGAARWWAWLTGSRMNMLFAASSLCIATWWLWAVAGLADRLGATQACEMSRMWPAYADYTDRMESPSGLAASAIRGEGKYRLLLYREGYLQPQPGAFPPTGRPALFVPGNAGSYGQVRSVASSSANQYWSHDYTPDPATYAGTARPEWDNLTAHGLDWWTIDLKEDFSAFHGDTLVEQAVFVNEVLSFLQRIYSHPQPNSIPILAHSMGGIVARLAMTLPEHPPGSVDTLVTLSTPHAHPVLAFDRGIAAVYRAINTAPPQRNRPLLVSIAGGALDIQVSPDAANVNLSPVWKGENITISSNAIPGTWCSVDHLAIMWCHQLRTRIATGFLQTALPGYGEKRKEMWSKALGLVLEDAPYMPDSGLIDLSHVASISLDYESPQSSLHLISNTAPLSVYQIRLCQQAVGGSCHILAPEHWRLLPPSFETPHPFPDPSAAYGTPGQGLWHALLPVSKLRSQGIQQISVERLRMDLGTFMIHSFAHEPTFAKELKVSDLRPYTRILLPEIDSSLKAFTMSVDIPPRHCLPPSTYKIAFHPLLRVSSAGASRDEVWYPSLTVGTKNHLSVALTGSAPLTPPNPSLSKGALAELWIDKMDMTGLSEECESSPIRIRLKRDWIASAGRVFMRLRTTLAIVPIIHLACVMAAALTDPNASTRSCILRSLLPAGVAAFVVLAGCDVLATLFPFWLPYPLSSTNTLGLGMSFSGIGLLERWAVMLLVVLAGTTFTLLGAGVLAVFLMGFAAGATLGRVGLADVLAVSLPQKSSRWGWVLFWRTLPSATVFLVVSFFLPHQVVLVILFIVQITVVVAFHNRSDTKSRADSLLLYTLFWLLPLRAPVLFVWVRNVTFGWTSPSGITLTHLSGMSEPSGDHNPFLILPFFALVQRSVAHSMRKSQPATRCAMPRILEAQLCALTVLAVVVGAAAPFKTYVAFDAVCLAAALYWALSARWRPWEDMRPNPDDGFTIDSEQRFELSHLPSASSSVPAALTIPDEVGTGQPSTEPELTPAAEVDFTVDALSSPQLSVASPSTRLDGEIKKYLDEVDRYQMARDSVNRSLTAGFVSLAKARLEVPAAGLGTRIGKDGLDARARVASIQVRIEQGPDTALRWRLVKLPPPPKKQKAESEKEVAREDEPKRTTPPLDPLYQFAALPPPALRRAQTQFRESLVSLISGPEVESSRPATGALHQPTVLASRDVLQELEKRVRAARAEL